MDKNADEILSGLVLELRRGSIVLCVLSQLGSPTYGYNLVQSLSEKGIPVDANTLYPLLRRLEGQGLLQSSWEVEGPKPRKYYSTTKMGDEIYIRLRKVWADTVKNMNALWEDKKDEQ
ncbi:PadR family transcriptional regulator [Eubacteriales bacterium OttesenSCG-928-K08]|nr:PadR family transcriptional regulator [Eubacteriales bacterium OttesenSCG-928-K08]